MSARPPAIGIDVRAAMRGPCGVGRYAVELARALLELPDGPRLLLYGASLRGASGRERLPAELLAGGRARLFAPRLPGKVVAALARVPGFRLERLIQWLGQGAHGPLELFHHTSLIFVRGLRCPEVVTVHDLAFEVSREFHDAGFHASVRARMQAAITRARAVIVPSQSTRRELVERWRVDAARIDVIPLGGDHLLRVPRGERRDPRPERARGYLVHVGTLEPRKNLPRLVRAFRTARARGLDLDLVLVGPWGWKSDELRAELAREDGGGRVAKGGGGSDRTAPSIFVRDQVDEPELRAWFEDARALVYPSLHEGFGLPIVEAFALGVPVVTSARSATLEVAGDAARLVDPESEQELADAMCEVGGDAALRAELAARGRRRAGQFTWAAAARATLAVYDRVRARVGDQAGDPVRLGS